MTTKLTRRRKIHSQKQKSVSSSLFVRAFVGAEGFSACMLDSVRCQLLQEETDALKTGTTYLHVQTLASFVQRALDVEEKQYVSTN
jgi:hypothetical protein